MPTTMAKIIMDDLMIMNDFFGDDLCDLQPKHIHLGL